MKRHRYISKSLNVVVWGGGERGKKKTPESQIKHVKFLEFGGLDRARDRTETKPGRVARE